MGGREHGNMANDCRPKISGTNLSIYTSNNFITVLGCDAEAWWVQKIHLAM
jgi:hypothetical protein